MNQFRQLVKPKEPPVDYNILKIKQMVIFTPGSNSYAEEIEIMIGEKLTAF